MSLLTRRGFLKAGGAAGVGLSIFSNIGAAYGKNTRRRIRQVPIILNSKSGRNTELGHRANSTGWDILSSGGDALDAVEKGANVIELDPNDTSVGYGGLPNEEGVVQLDSQVIDGKTYNFGAVGCIENIKTPCSVARLVMERSDHIMLVGAGALKFAKAHGFKEENLLTENARKIWLNWKENVSDNDDWLAPKKKGGNEDIQEDYDEDDYWNNRLHGTVNVLSVDSRGDVAGITTTSGLAWKIPGRCGDSPIIGAGLYVDNKVGAAGATGRGEEVIKVCGSFMVIEFMRNGMGPQEACEAICKRIIDNYGGNVDFNDKFVALSKDGELGCANVRGRKGRKPTLVYCVDGERKVYTGENVLEY